MFVLLYAVMLVTSTLYAQSGYVSDTLVGRSDNYYYSAQTDSCQWFLPQSGLSFHQAGSEGVKDQVIILAERSNRRMAVKGIAVAVQRLKDYYRDYLAEGWSDLYFHSPNPTKHEEYVYLCDGDIKRLTIRDSARWDLLTPRQWILSSNQDTLTDNSVSIDTNYLYEAYFKEPQLVDSTFFMAGSFYSNTIERIKYYIPTKYIYFVEEYDMCSVGCVSDSVGGLYVNYKTEYLNRLRAEMYAYIDSVGLRDNYRDSVEIYLDNYRRRIDRYTYGYFGPFFAIVDFYQLDVAANDSLKGSVSGSGRYPDRSLDTIEAHAYPGFCFVQWDDGNTSNPRIVDLAQDTLFTAVFDTCTVQDIASPDPLHFTVVPNPAHGTLTVGTPTEDSYQLQLYDMAGRCVKKTSFTGRAATLDLGDLPAGSYHLSLHSAHASGIKVIVKQ